jgi:hypothetical protein
MGDFRKFLVIMFGVLALEDFYRLFDFPIFWFWAFLMKVLNVPDERIERSWWKVWAFLMKCLSVPDERFERSWWKVWAFLMKGLSVPDERFERSWWKVISEPGLAHYILYLRFFLAILLLLFILNGFSLHHICYFIEILICMCILLYIMYVFNLLFADHCVNKGYQK